MPSFIFTMESQDTIATYESGLVIGTFGMSAISFGEEVK